MPRFRMHPLRSNTLLDLWRLRDAINLYPSYQRLGVWDPDKQRLFIDSIINAFDVPKLYFHELPRPDTVEGRELRYAIIDGKQRMLAIWAFMDGRLRLAPEFQFFDDESLHAGGASYDELRARFPLLRARFDGFQLPVVLVQADSEEDVEGLFTRLNEAVPLTAPEKRNALGGPLPFPIRKIAAHHFFQKTLDNRRVRNNRYQHLDLAAKLLYITNANGFVSTKKLILDDFVKDYRKLRDQGDTRASPTSVNQLVDSTVQLLARMANFFREGEPVLSGAGRITLYAHVFRLLGGAKPPFDLRMIEGFHQQVDEARARSQQRARGDLATPLTREEERLTAYDRDKQSVNDGGALTRQYDVVRWFLDTKFKVKLPPS